MNEFELIAQLTQSLPANASVVVGPGDDCAVIDAGLPGDYLLLKTDAVAEGVHFDAAAAPEQIGHKALGRCLSDIAAMGGAPTAALVTLGLPKGFDPAFVKKIYEGLGSLARRFDAAIVGGETTANPGGLFISVALLGRVSRERCVLRSGAKAGDALFVSGELGGSRAGKHLDFVPRIAEAQWLVNNFTVHAMIDISDGLAGDLRRILERSGGGAEILASAVPVSLAAKRAARGGDGAKPALAAALSDGEDFELLFAVASGDATGVLDGWKAQFPDVRLSCVGKITEPPGIRIRDKTGARALEAHGYDHFA